MQWRIRLDPNLNKQSACETVLEDELKRSAQEGKDIRNALPALTRHFIWSDQGALSSIAYEILIYVAASEPEPSSILLDWMMTRRGDFLDVTPERLETAARSVMANYLEKGNMQKAMQLLHYDYFPVSRNAFEVVTRYSSQYPSSVVLPLLIDLLGDPDTEKKYAGAYGTASGVRNCVFSSMALLLDGIGTTLDKVIELESIVETSYQKWLQAQPQGFSIEKASMKTSFFRLMNRTATRKAMLVRWDDRELLAGETLVQPRQRKGNLYHAVHRQSY